MVLQNKGGLVHEQMGNAVRNEAWQVLDNDGLLAEARKQLQQRVDGPIRGVESTDYFDGRLQVNRIHEVEAHHVGRALGGTRYSRNGNARGIGAKADLGWHHSIQMFIDRLLDVPVLRHVLDDEFTRRDVLQIGRQNHALQGLISRYPWQGF